MSAYKVGPCGETYKVVAPEEIKRAWFFLYAYDGWTYWSNSTGRQHYATRKHNPQVRR